MVAPITVNIICNKASPKYSPDDIAHIEKLLKVSGRDITQIINKAKVYDIRELLIHSDIQFHIGIPIFSAIPWAHTNILVVNQEDWSIAYENYVHAFDAILFKDDDTANTFKSTFTDKGILTDNIYTEESFGELLGVVVKNVMERRPKSGHFHCPPVLQPLECPAISVITPTYNRGNLIQIAFHNLLATDYPHDKIEWVVIEDNEKRDKMYSEDIINFQIQVPQIKIKYIPIEGRMSIGEKRNHGVENASNDIILFMDDDDHYPSTSFRRRVAWLTKGTKCGETGKAEIACCTTLALYDLKTGISAVNVPPYDIQFAQRISEATLTFKKSAWIERKFQNVSVSEGEDWISGRESAVIEMPPQQIIVAFSHGNNKSSRRIPPSETPPGCFWGFPKEYLMFIHKLVGVEVEDSNTKAKSKEKTK